MNSKHINILSAIYIVAPVFLFFAGWLRLWIAIPVLLVCVISLASFIGREGRKEKYITFSLKELFPTMVLICLWVYFSGIGGLVFQNTDHRCRNAIFDILVNYDWPVINDGRGLIYYIGFWLPSAVVGKIFGLTSGYLFQVVWAILGVFLCSCLMFEYFGKVSTKAVVVFIIFSGLDILGVFLGEGSMQSFDHHIEWWTEFLQYSSFTTQLFWVFNQAIYGWIITLMIMKQEDNRYIVFLWSCGLLSCTFPFAGMLPFMVFKIIKNIRNGAKRDWVSLRDNLFTYSNVFGGGCIGIITFLYEISNISATNTNTVVESTGSIKVKLAMYILFLILEVGVYWLPMYKYQCTNPLYWLCGGVLVVCPWIEVGKGGDFCMRASIPALLILMLLVMDTYRKAKLTKDYSIILLILITLLVGSCTPLIEFNRTTRRTYNLYMADEEMVRDVTSYENIFSGSNFSGSADDSFFFRNLVRK